VDFFEKEGEYHLVEATHKDGVLTVVMPHTEDSKKKRSQFINNLEII